MKPLIYCHSYGMYLEVKKLLNEKGIPIYTRDAGDGGRTPYLIFVCLESQFDDALRLLHDHSHSPSVSVDTDSFYKQAYASNLPMISKTVTMILILLILVFATVAAVRFYFFE